jgi:hypothetical protein
MAKRRKIVTIDEGILRGFRSKAVRTGKRDSEVIEESLRRDLGLGALEEIWARVKAAPEKEGLALAYAELHAMRRERDAGSGT